MNPGKQIGILNGLQGMKINVIGATGNLGSLVINSLLAQGANPSDLIASVRTPAKADGLRALGIEVRRADYDDYESLVTAFQGTDVLLLIPTFAAPEPRVIQHGNAIRAAEAAGVKRTVFSSVATASPESLFKVAPFILYAESRLRLSKMEWTILRNNMYMDSMLGWLPRFMEEGQIPYPLKEGRIAFIMRKDLGRATAACLMGEGHEGKIYELTGPEALSMPELAKVLSEVTGKEIKFGQPSETDYVHFSHADNASEAMLDTMLSIYRAAEVGEWGNATDDVFRLTGKKALSVSEVANQKVSGK